MSNIAFEVALAASHEQALEAVTAALDEEGFGVLTRIDVHDAFRAKLNVAFRPYSILGACNPKLAHRALSARADIGLMLPCNIVVESVNADRAVVRIADPGLMVGLGDFAEEPELGAVAAEAAERLRRVAERLRG